MDYGRTQTSEMTGYLLGTTGHSGHVEQEATGTTLHDRHRNGRVASPGKRALSSVLSSFSNDSTSVTAQVHPPLVGRNEGLRFNRTVGLRLGSMSQVCIHHEVWIVN